MEQLTFPIIVAVAVALFVWAIGQAISGLLGGAQRRVSQRLSSDGKNFHATEERSILLQGEQTRFSKVLTRKTFFQRVQRQLIVVWPRVSVSRFVIMSAGVGVGAMIVALLVISSPLLLLVIGLAAAYVPFILLANKAAKRTRTLSDQLPEAMDFLARILRAGHSLTTGLQMLGTELPDPLAGEFRKCYDQHSLGQPLDECLKELAERVESTEFAFFVTAVLIQRRNGGAARLGVWAKT
jgi:tight adherence protein B